MADLKKELKSKLRLINKKNLTFYYFEAAGTMGSPKLIIDVAGTAKAEAKLYSKEIKKSHTCKGIAKMEGGNVVFEVSQGGAKPLDKALRKKPFMATVMNDAIVRKGAGDTNVTFEAGSAEEAQKFERRVGKIKGELENIDDLLQEWEGLDAGNAKLAAKKAELKALKRACKAAIKKATDGSVPAALKDLKQIKNSARSLLQVLESDKKNWHTEFTGSAKEKEAIMRRLEKANLEIVHLKDLSARWAEDKPIGWVIKKKRLDQKIVAYEQARDRAVALGATNAKQGYKDLKAVKEGARKDSQKELELFDSTPQPTPITIGQGNDAFDLQLDHRSIAGFEGMTDQEKTDAITRVTANITAGKALFGALDDRDLTAAPPTKEEVAQLMWYIRTMAENKAEESFFKNALTIPDPDQKFHKFISAVPGVHSRGSSHVSEPRKNTSDNRGYGQGVDFYGDIELPYDLKTALFHSIDFTDEDGNTETRMYIKMETEGFTNTPTSLNELVMDIKHGFNWVSSKFSHSDMGMSAYREGVPESVLTQYEAVLTKAKSNSELSAALKNGNYQNNIFTMIQNITDVVNRIDNLVTESDIETIDTLLKFSDVLEREVGSDIDDEALSHRVGGEIVLEPNDLL